MGKPIANHEKNRELVLLFSEQPLGFVGLCTSIIAKGNTRKSREKRTKGKKFQKDSLMKALYYWKEHMKHLHGLELIL